MTTRIGKWWYAEAREGLRNTAVIVILAVAVPLILGFCGLLFYLFFAGGAQFLNWLGGVVR